MADRPQGLVSGRRRSADARCACNFSASARKARPRCETSVLLGGGHLARTCARRPRSARRPGRSRSRASPRTSVAMAPSHTPSATSSRPSGQRDDGDACANRAVRAGHATSASSRSSFATLSAYPVVLPVAASRVDARARHRATSTSRPVSSATRRQPGRPHERRGLQPGVALERRRVLHHLGTSAGGAAGRPRRPGCRRSRPPCRGWPWPDQLDGHGVNGPAAAAGGGSATNSSCRSKISMMPPSASASSASSSPRREGHALGGALHLDVAALGGHHHVHVDLGLGVLGVGQVEHRHAVDDADADRRAVGDERWRSQPRRPGRSRLKRVVQGEVAAADRRRAGAAVGLQHVAVDDDLALAERPHVGDGPQRPADQPLDLHRAPALLAPGRLPVDALGRRARAASSTRPSPSPCRVPRIQRGTSSSIDAVHSTRVRPNETSTEPAAISVKSRSKVIGRSSSGARPSGRGMVSPSGRRVGSSKVQRSAEASSGPRRRRPRSCEPCHVARRVPSDAGAGGRPGSRGRRRSSSVSSAHLEGRLVGRADEHDVAAHHVGDHPGQVRVVGAAEQQGVDVGRLASGPAAARPASSPGRPRSRPARRTRRSPGTPRRELAPAPPWPATARW